MDWIKYFSKPQIPLEKLFFTSDTHFGHGNIIKWCRRPYDGPQEMDEALVRNWNSVVPPDGIVYHLGDFAFASQERWKALRESLNGQIVLIRGNHDLKENLQNQEFLESTFDLVRPKFPLILGPHKIWLTHEPLLCFGGAYNLFGHVHCMNNGQGNLGEDYPRLKLLGSNQYDVGVDFNHYTPISWPTLKERLDEQQKRNVNMIYWIGK